MASPRTADDLLQPLGMLTPGLFPNFDDDDDLATFLETLLGKGYEAATAKGVDDVATRDLIAEAWAYHRAYLAVWQRMTTSPSTARIDGEAERQYLVTQFNGVAKLADSWLATYNALLPATVTTATRGGAVSPDVATVVRF